VSFLQSIFSRSHRAGARPKASSPERRLREMFDAADSIVVLTGAGLSAGSGLVPAADGEAPPPVRYRHFLVDQEARLEHWRRSLADAASYAGANPNPGHVALTTIARTRRLKVVTSSVDGLHGRSGLHAEDHIEINGNGLFAMCSHCGERTPIEAHAAAVAEGRSPTCKDDGTLLKPASCLFGEPPLRSAVIRSEEWAGSCDLILAAGADLAKGPIQGIVAAARQSGTKVAIVSAAPVALDFEPDLLVEGDAAATLASLAR
jgi:NAD-dependent deacetylase